MHYNYSLPLSPIKHHVRFVGGDSWEGIYTDVVTHKAHQGKGQ